MQTSSLAAGSSLLAAAEGLSAKTWAGIVVGILTAMPLSFFSCRCASRDAARLIALIVALHARLCVAPGQPGRSCSARQLWADM